MQRARSNSPMGPPIDSRCAAPPWSFTQPRGASAPCHLRFTFPTRFSRTYKRTSPKFSTLVRAYTVHVSPCAFSQETTQIATRPNSRPPKHLPSPQKLFSPIVTLQFIDAAPHSKPRPSGLPLERSEGGRGHLSNAPAQPRRRAPFRLFDFSIFRRFHQPPQHTPATSVGTFPARPVSPYVTSPSHARMRRQAAWHSVQLPIVVHKGHSKKNEEKPCTANQPQP